MKENEEELIYKRKYSRLQSLFFTLYELKLESEEFKDDNDVITVEEKEYFDTVKLRIEECKEQISKIIKED